MAASLAVCGCGMFTRPQTAYDQIASKISHGDLGGALADVDRASRRYGSKEEWDWRFRILKAQILISQSQPKEALSLLDGELPPSLAHKDVAVRKILFEAIGYRYAQQFDKSEQKLEQAERLAASTQPQLLSGVLTARGVLEVDQIKYSAAEHSFRQALTLARQQNDSIQEVNALGNLARLLTKEERFDESIDLSQSALQLARTIKFENAATTILGNMGFAYFQLGDLENSLAFYQQAQQGSEKAALTGYGAYWLSLIADVHYANRDYPAAEQAARRALEVARALDDKKTIITCLNDLSRIAVETGRFDPAGQYNREALALEDAGFVPAGRPESLLLSGRILAGKRKFRQAEDAFHKVADDPDSDTPFRWEAAGHLAELDEKEGLPAEAERQYRRAIDTIQTAQASIGGDDLRLSFLSSGIEFYDDYIDFLVARHRPDDALRIAELSRARTLAEGLSSGATATAAPARNLYPQRLARQLKATLLFYWLGHAQSYLWVITPTKTTLVLMPKSAEIDPLVKSYEKAVPGLRNLHEASDAGGQKLYSMLIEPAKKLIPFDSRVIVLPADILYGLNFETLVVPDPKLHFWIEDVTLTTASSLTLLASSASQPPTKVKTLLLVGNTEPPNSEFPALKLASAEMAGVERYFPESNRRILEGKEATPSAYASSRPERFAYLHFVTHGTASHTHPLDSAVVLSPEGDSYKLYGREIVKHRLVAQLVTISACNGAGTRTYSGEGLVGLSWAFLRAGAHNVIGALWEVSDASTPLLMDALYAELSRGKDPATALRAAKLSLLHRDDVYQKPFYWAPFQLYAGS